MPQRISSAVVGLNLTGYVMPAFHNSQPVIMELDDAPGIYIAVFSTPKRLRAAMVVQKIKYDKIMQIDNGKEFVQSIVENKNPDLHLIVDPRRIGDGKLKYIEVQLGERPLPQPT